MVEYSVESTANLNGIVSRLSGSSEKIFLNLGIPWLLRIKFFVLDKMPLPISVTESRPGN